MAKSNHTVLIAGLAVAGIAIAGAYILTTDLINIVPNTLNKIYQNVIETPSLKSGANNATGTNNYDNATIIYTTPSTAGSANNTLNNALKTAQVNPIIVVSPNGQNEATYGGQPAPMNQSVAGSASKPFDYVSGYQGAGYYYLRNNVQNTTIIDDIANVYDYDNSYLTKFYNANPSQYS